MNIYCSYVFNTLLHLYTYMNTYALTRKTTIKRFHLTGRQDVLVGWSSLVTRPAVKEETTGSINRSIDHETNIFDIVWYFIIWKIDDCELIEKVLWFATIEFLMSISFTLSQCTYYVYNIIHLYILYVLLYNIYSYILYIYIHWNLYIYNNNNI